MKKGTYDVLIFLGIVSHLWYSDAPVGFFGFLGFA